MRQIGETVRGGDWKLRGVVESWIEEPALAVHFEIGHERVPMRN